MKKEKRRGIKREGKRAGKGKGKASVERSTMKAEKGMELESKNGKGRRVAG